MAIPSNWETEMERYLNRQMSDEENQRFENELNNDPLKLKDLQNRMKAELSVISTAREEEVSSLRSRYKSGGGKVRSFNFGYLAVAAAVLLLIGLAVFLRPEPELDPQAVFAANYEVPAAPQARGDNGLDSLFQAANLLYNQKQYEAATSAYLQYLKGDTDSLKSVDYQNARLFLAISLIETNKLKEAILHLNNVMDKDEVAQWYLALALLKQKKVEDSKKVLMRIAGEERHLYQARAAKLLELFP